MRLKMLVAAAAIALSGCGGAVTGPSDVVSRTWQLAELHQNGVAPVIVQDPARYTLQLAENGRANVMSDCNSCSGTYSLNDSSLNMGTLTCTLIACREGSLDPLFPQLLEGQKAITTDDSEMIVRGSSATLRFVTR